MKLWAAAQTLFVALIFAVAGASVSATPFTTTVPTTGVALPDDYPEAGGVAIVMTGVNGNIYYQFSDPDGAFRGFNTTGQPTRFRGNPFTINDPISLDCGFSPCRTYFGGGLARIDIRFSAFDGDTQVGGFDEDDITLRINNFDVGSWSGLTTERTSTDGIQSLGFETGFGNNVFNTGWFASTDQALLENILDTNQTVAQVFDADPNDNYWDFRQGPRLSNVDIRTIAPGYEFEKTLTAGPSPFAVVGDTLEYSYVVRNIGSVRISDITVVDDKIPNVSCPVAPGNVLEPVASGAPAPNQLTCTGVYVVTQEDVDAGGVTNIAQASGTPEFGELGAVTGEVRVDGPALDNDMSFAKTGSPDPFGAANTDVTYTFTITNEGNTTLSNVVVTDPKLPGLSCTIPTILPLSVDNTINTASCSATYPVSQEDVDDFALNGVPLDNTATVNATGPDGEGLTDTAMVSLDGQPAAPTLTLDKSALQTEYAAIGDEIDYRFLIRNTGNVTWPDAPVIADAITDGAICPAGPVAPDTEITCAATLTITQAHLDDEEVVNTATAEITVGGVLASDTGEATVTADVTRGLALEKRLAAASPNPFDAVGQTLVYEYVLTNTGNVTLENLSVTDDKVAVSCPITTIAPTDAPVVCTSAPYAIDLDDLNAGDVTNTASATGDTLQGVAVSSPEVMLTVPADQNPTLAIVKTAPLVDPLNFVEGLVVRYTFDVENTGNVTITDPIVINDDKFPNPITCLSGPLVPEGTGSCFADYTVTALDVLNGFVTNQAFATDGVTQSPVAVATIPQGGNPTIAVEKAADTAAFNAASDRIDYTFTVRNTGTTNIIRENGGTSVSPITINDSQIAPGNLTCNQPLVFFPGDTFTCSGFVQPVGQAAVDAGAYTNTATASFPYQDPTDPTAPLRIVTSAPSAVTVPSAIVPDFTLSKSTTDTFGLVGDTLTYALSVTNLTDETLASVTITDPLVPGFSCTLTSVGPMATANCPNPVTYDVDLDDLDLGRVDNTATAVATSATGDVITRTDNETVLFTPATPAEVLTFNKTASPTTFTGPGEPINYTLSVTNDGLVTLTNIVVTDPDLGLTCTIPSLAPTDTDASCIGTRLTTQEDVDAGLYVNAATAEANGVAPVPSAATVTGPARVADYIFTKTASSDFTAVGDRVTFTLSLENTGNVTLTNIALRDTFFDPDLICSVASLTPGATDTSCAREYVVTQDDIDAGEIVNMGSFTSDGVRGGPSLSDTATATSTGPARAPSIAVDKVERDGSGSFALNAVENYDFTITNTGNVTLRSVMLDDAPTGYSCLIGDMAPGAIVTSCPNGGVLETSITPDQDDVDAGILLNTVTVTGDPDGLAQVTGTDSVSLAGPDQLPALSTVKTVNTGDNFAAIGDTITYFYDVTNTGNITLTAPIMVADDLTTVTCPALRVDGLAIGDSLRCEASYTVDQDDLNAGEVVNTASASIDQPVVPSATHPSGTASVESPDVMATATAAQNPELRITKRIKPGTPSTYAGIGDLSDPANPNNITFEFLVTNSGNVTITEDIVVTDTLIPTSNLVCSTANVAPGDTVICEGVWPADQASIDDGSFTNRATAATSFDGAPVVTAVPGEATAFATQLPALETAKAFVNIREPAPSNAVTNVFNAGNIVTYNFTVTNTGNTTITAPLTVNDNLIGAVDCGTGDLAPGADRSCTATYTISAANFALGVVTNLASATDGTTTSPTVTQTVPVGVEPAITLTKSLVSVNGPTGPTGGFVSTANTITYRYTIENTSPDTGGVRPALGPVFTVSDDKFPGTLVCDSGAALDPDASFVCEQTYTVTQADLDAVSAGVPGGFVTNTASAQTTFAGQPVTSNVDTVTVLADANPDLTVLKTAVNLTNPGAPADIIAGVPDTLEFTITVLNSGNQTMSNIMVSDPMLSGLSCTVNGLTPANLVIAPGQEALCTGTYPVSQQDIDAGIVTNTAMAEGATPQGQIIQSDGTTTYPVASAAPALTVTKALIPNGGPSDYSTPGEVLQFRITVENTGNVTFNDISVTDSEVPGTCDVGTLAPDASDNSCIFEYTVQQIDIDNGTFLNTATATGTPAVPGGTPTGFSGDAISTGPARMPGIGVGKLGTGPLAAGTFNMEGDQIDYVFTVANQGNVTLNEIPVLVDDKIGPITDCDPLPATGLLPTETIECRGSYTVDQDDVDAGFVTNVVDVTMVNEYDPGGPLLEATATETVDAARAPAMLVEKEASDDMALIVGAEITYTYTVRNTGNVRLLNVALADAHTNANGVSNLTILPDDTILAIEPGDFATRTALYTVTQEDVDAGVPLTNTLTAEAMLPPGLDPITGTADESVSLDPKAAAMRVLKTVPALPAVLEDGTDVTFRITVENTGNVTLGLPNLTDTLSTVNDLGAPDVTLTPVFQSGNDGDPAEFNVDEVFVYEVTYRLTQADVDAGGITNTVTDTATDPQGETVTDVSDNGAGDGDDPTIVPIAPAGGLDVIKTVRTAAPDPAEPGDAVVFEVRVANTGNVTLTAPVLTDTLSRADGVEISPAPSAVFEGGDGGTVGSLDVDEVWTYTVTHALTQDDIDAGGLSNTVTAVANAPNGTPVSDISHDRAGGGSDPTTTPINATPGLAVVKTVTSTLPAVPAPNDIVTFTIVVENTGNVTLTAPVLTDTLSPVGASAVSPNPVPVFVPSSDTDGDGALDVDETWEYRLDYPLTQADIDAGGVENTVLAAADAPNGDTVDDVSNNADMPGSTPTTATLNQAPGLEAIKTIINAPQVAGDLVQFEITVKNTGNVTLSGVNIASDTLTRAGGTPVLTLTELPDFIAADDGSVDGTLKAGETATYRAAYILQQDDIDAGGIANTATAEGTPPGSALPISDVSDNGTGAGSDPTALVIVPDPSLDLVKRLIDGGPTYDSTDDVLTFAFDVTNTGNVTIDGPVTIDDPLLTSLGGTVDCPVVDLLPDDDITCTGSFTVTQDQIDAGSLTNTATAVSALASSDVSSVTVLAQQNPALETAKEAVSITVDGVEFAGVPNVQFRVGAIIAYEYTVTNTGNVTITDAISVTDNLIDPVTCPALPGGALAPMQSLVCEATFEVTSDDVAVGSVTNLASATDGTTTSDIVSETVPAGGIPALTTVKALVSAQTEDGTDIPSLAFSTVGDVLVYEFTVTNSGEVSFVGDVSVIDDKIPDPIVCFTPTADDPDLFQGETITCEGRYSVTQDDLDNGSVTNTAFSQTFFGVSYREVVSEPVMETATAAEDPGFVLTKSAATLPVTAVNQVLTYTLQVENTGNQTLRQVSISDPLLDGFVCAAPVLDPGDTLACAQDYTVSQDDVDRGFLLNMADASALSPRGVAITDETELRIDMPASDPGVAIAKVATVDPFGPAGSTIQYRFDVTNTGNTTLRDVMVTDEIVTPPFTCTIPELGVGATDTTCLLGYTVTQADVDRGSITNMADVVATDPFGAQVTGSDTINTDGAVAAPSLVATKTASVTEAPVAGSVVDFTLSVINNGNVTLSDLGVTDTMTRADGAPITLDAPFAFVDGDANGDDRLNLSETWTFTATYTLTQDDVDAGGIVNIAEVSARDPLNGAVVDIADDGDDSDGNTVDDPTVVTVTPVPAIEVTKSVGTTGANAGDTVTFDVTVLNTGNVTLSSFALADTMTNADGTDVSAGVIGPNRVGPNDPVPPRGTATFEVSYVLTQADVDSGGLANLVLAEATGSGGVSAADTSDSADPADGAGDADPTIMAIIADPDATITKQAGTPARQSEGIFDLPFTITATNTGNVTLENLTLTDDLIAFAAPARVVSVTTPVVAGLTSGSANAGFDGVGDIDLLLPGAFLAPGDQTVVTFTVRLDVNDGEPANPNIVNLGSDTFGVGVAGSAELPPLALPELFVTKSVSPGRALLGDIVTYTIQVDNEGVFDETALTVVDEMPVGLRFIPGSGRVNGNAAPEPAIAGRRLSWAGLRVDGGDTLTVTLQARVIQGPGRFENTAFVLSATGDLISNVASAVLEVPPEAVFDCGDVIGRVFDDRNLNGYQDGVPQENRALITDQTYDGSKFTAPPADEPGAEEGIAGVRIATVDGTIITTDAYGRFSVPCAALPADIGSNFTLKLDESSLPTGYRVTSENPRTLRLTPGTMTRMNFGAGLGDVIDVSLTNAAFPNGQPSEALRQGVQQLVSQLTGAPSVLKLRYYTNGESRAVARARLDAVEALLRDAWPRGARYDLKIERTIAGMN